MQLFTHLLSSYLQGMGDFFSALPWGGLGRGFGLLEMTLAGSYLLIREHVPIDT